MEMLTIEMYVIENCGVFYTFDPYCSLMLIAVAMSFGTSISKNNILAHACENYENIQEKTFL